MSADHDMSQNGGKAKHNGPDARLSHRNRRDTGFPEESEKFCTLDKISFEKSLLVGALKKRRDTVGEPISPL
jgi:hypothetical protein